MGSVGAQGVRRGDKKKRSAMLKNSPYAPDEFELSDDIEVCELGGDVAIVAYESRCTKRRPSKASP